MLETYQIILQLPTGEEWSASWEYEEEDCGSAADADYYREETFNQWAKESGAIAWRYVDSEEWREITST